MYVQSSSYAAYHVVVLNLRDALNRALLARLLPCDDGNLSTLSGGPRVDA